METKIVVSGANGKMGQIVCQALSEQKKFKLISKVTSTNELIKVLKKNQCDIVIDFSTPYAVYRNLSTIIEFNCHPIIGTTGLKLDQIEYFKKKCSKKFLGGIIAPNFSLGANYMIKCAKYLAKYFKNIEIIELHHDKKIDKPSGTSLKTVASIKEEQKKLKIPYHNIPIHSIRLPGLLAHQEIIFGSLGETLHIKHNTIDRTCFLPGIFLACEKVKSLKTLVYGLDQILE